MVSTTEQPGVASDRMPRPVAWAAGVTLAALLLGAAYLWVVRGEVLFLEKAFAYFCL